VSRAVAALLALLGTLAATVSLPAKTPSSSRFAFPDSMLPDSVRVIIVPDSLLDSSGTFTQAPEPPSSAPAIAPGRLHEEVTALRRHVQFNRHDVEAFAKLGELLGTSRNIEERREAAEALHQALALRGNDPDLWLGFGRLQERRGFHAEAHDAYIKALRLAPDRTDIWESMAQHEFVRFQRQLRWKHLDDSWRANQHVLAVNPEDVASLRRGVRIAMLDDDRAAADSLVRQWEAVAPNDPWAMLVRGMLFADDGAWEQADRAFARGIAALPERERRPFQRLDIVSQQDEELRKESPDRLRFFRDWWKWRDPTPADAVNPRLLEHYRRMVQAELLFALESYHLHGWNHAPGEMLVRYGLPKGWTFRHGFGRLGEYRVSAFALMSSRSVEIPYGPDAFPIEFVDYNLNGRFYYPINGYPADEELLLAEFQTAYEPPVDVSHEQELEVWRFQDPDGVGRLEVSVALSRKDWKDLLKQPYRITSKVTVYNKDWEATDARVGSWAPFTVDPLGRLVARFETEGISDSMIVGLETSDRDETNRAAGYETVPPHAVHDAPELSDLAFVSRVSFEHPQGAYGWGYGSALPNPGHRYRAGDPIGIAFEAYNLRPDSEGQVQSRIRVSVQRETRTGWMRVVLGKRKSGEAELVFDASERGPTLHQLLALDLPPLDSGHYLLRLHVEDKVSGAFEETSGMFEILDSGWKP
jgi:GWxTD domain-containing protein